MKKILYSIIFVLLFAIPVSAVLWDDASHIGPYAKDDTSAIGGVVSADIYSIGGQKQNFFVGTNGDDATFCKFVGPHFIYDPDNDKVYTCWQGTDHDIYGAVYDIVNKQWSPMFKIATNPIVDSTDGHGAPALVQDDLGYLTIFYGNSADGSTTTKKKSLLPNTMTAWSSASTFSADIVNYPQFLRINNGDVYYFHRYGAPSPYNFRWQKSTDNLANFSAAVVFVEGSETYPWTYKSLGAYDATNERIFFTWNLRYDLGGLVFADRNIYCAFMCTGLTGGGEANDGMTINNIYALNTDESYQNLGTSVTVAEADTYCLVQESADTDDELHCGYTHLDPDGYPHIIFLREDGSDYYAEHIRWVGTGWKGSNGTDATSTRIAQNASKYSVPEFTVHSTSDIDCIQSQTTAVSTPTMWNWDGSDWNDTHALDWASDYSMGYCQTSTAPATSDFRYQVDLRNIPVIAGEGNIVHINDDYHVVETAAYDIDAQTYIDRVVADGGQIVDPFAVQYAVKWLKANDFWDTCQIWYSPDFGAKFVGSAAIKFYNLCYPNLALDANYSASGGVLDLDANEIPTWNFVGTGCMVIGDADFLKSPSTGFMVASASEAPAANAWLFAYSDFDKAGIPRLESRINDSLLVVTSAIQDYSGNTSSVTMPIAITVDENYLTDFSFDSDLYSSGVYVNGMSAGTPTKSGTITLATADKAVIGALATGSGYGGNWKGTISSVGPFFDEELSDADREIVRDFLFDKYNITPWYWEDTEWRDKWCAITIDHTKVDSTQTDQAIMLDASVFLTNAPNMLDSDETDDCAQNGGGDIRFSTTTPSSAPVQIPCEIVSFVTNSDPASATAEIWIPVSSLSSTEDTVIYCAWHTSGSSTQPAIDATYGAENVWGSDYLMAQHLEDATTSTITDSTSNDNDGTKYAANEPVEIAGQIGNAQDFDGTDDYIDTAFVAIPTGGTITTDGNYTLHTFTSSGTFTTGLSLDAEVLVVAGGGGGGASVSTKGGGGGGGAGGLLYDSSYSVSSGETSVTVGASGAGGDAGTGNRGTSGGNSVFGTMTAIGGGGGGSGDPAGNYAGYTGGSGGGAGFDQYVYRAGSAGTSGQGYAGGGNSTGGAGGGGGGGASAVGLPPSLDPTHNGGIGGAGLSYNISGSSVTYAAGGRGGSAYDTTGATGSSNTGNGGGGAYSTASAGAGGSGIVIIKYLTADLASSSYMWAKPTSTGTWEHIAYNGTTYYKNGEEGTPTAYPIFENAIGKTGASAYFDGIIDEFVIKSGAMTEAEINAIYNNQYSPATFMTSGAIQTIE